jgi:hypothetical protein
MPVSRDRVVVKGSDIQQPVDIQSIDGAGMQARGDYLPTLLVGGSNVTDYEPITPSDSTDLPKTAIALIVTGNEGTISVIKPNGGAATIPASVLPLGSIVPLPVKRVKLTGTTATGIWVVY